MTYTFSKREWQNTGTDVGTLASAFWSECWISFILFVHWEHWSQGGYLPSLSFSLKLWQYLSKATTLSLASRLHPSTNSGVGMWREEEDKRMTEWGRIEQRTFHSINLPIIIAPWKILFPRLSSVYNTGKIIEPGNPETLKLYKT